THEDSPHGHEPDSGHAKDECADIAIVNEKRRDQYDKQSRNPSPKRMPLSSLASKFTLLITVRGGRKSCATKDCSAQTPSQSNRSCSRSLRMPRNRSNTA